MTNAHVPAIRPTTASPARRWRRRLLGVAFGVAFAGVAAELGLRVWNALRHPSPYVLDAELGWRLAPGVERTLRAPDGREVAFAIDERGHRRLPSSPPSAPRARVLVLGDSFVQGSEVRDEELFVADCARRLPDVAFAAAGVGGWSTLQEVRALSRELAAVRPTLVVLVVYDNDFADNLMPYFSGIGARPCLRLVDDVVQAVEGRAQAFAPFLLPMPGAPFWYEHSALYRALHKNLFLPRRGVELARREADERAALPLADQRAAMAWCLRSFAQQLAPGVRGHVAAIPAWERALAGADPQHAWLAATCQELGLPFTSLVPALQAVGAAAYFTQDIHLTAAGHAAVAAALAPVLQAALTDGR